MKDYIILENYGHGESIEVIKENDKTYIWIGNTVNKRPSSKGKAFRSVVAIADESNHIYFRAQVDDLNESTYYGVYKLDEINHKLNLNSATKMNINNFKSSQVFYFTNLKCPDGYFQGFDITELGLHNIYLW